MVEVNNPKNFETIIIDALWLDVTNLNNKFKEKFILEEKKKIRASREQRNFAWLAAHF